MAIENIPPNRLVEKLFFALASVVLTYAANQIHSLTDRLDLLNNSVTALTERISYLIERGNQQDKRIDRLEADIEELRIVSAKQRHKSISVKRPTE